MDIVSQPAATRDADEPTQPRYDMYAPIHKALRAFMSDTLTLVGRADWLDDEDTRAALSQMRDLLRICEVHVHDENGFVHPAIEARRPGASKRIAAEHEDHLEEIRALERALSAVERSRGARRTETGHAVYHELALFVAANFEHMHYEETAHNAALWAAYSDAELERIEGELVASIPPEAMAMIAPWMLRYVSHAERVTLLAGMRKGAPPEVFEGMLGLAAAQLGARDWGKLALALQLPVARAA